MINLVLSAGAVKSQYFLGEKTEGSAWGYENTPQDDLP